MTTIPDLIRLYIRGFKQLFYYRPGEKGEKGKLSILKIILFIFYISAFIFSFLQFAEGNVSDIAIQKFDSDAIESGNYDGMFPLSSYGVLAILMNFSILVGAGYFLIIRDKPLTVKRFKGFIKEFLY